jgi:peptidyl-prolyl cis-trans isomerase D
MEQDRRTAVTAFAAKLVERINGGESLDAVAKEIGARVDKTSPPVTRNTSPPGLPNTAVQQAFALPKDRASSATSSDGKSRIILRVAEVIPAPPPTAEQTKRLKDDLARQLQGDTLVQYVGGLHSRYGFSVNEAALKQALGTESEPTDLQ